ncbi:SURF1 family protein [Sphingomonas aracearum]|uniref:SURF1 family protein n=1 Tax=Sphingomonas aracearum TaxID=2283317 RepID=UPI00269210EE
MSAGRGKRFFFIALCTLATLAFVGLGMWQVQRRAWKLELIAATAARVHAPPVALPPPSRWATVNAHDDAYRRLRVSGTFRHDREALVQALTERGAGYWVLTPLRTDTGTVLINRGFVPEERRAPQSRAAGQVGGRVTVTGLLRISEPGGALLRANQPAADRWYSRDVGAIARARRLGPVAPFFIDADATPNPGGWPVGGLTVIAFPNSHLVYALTWFALAALSAFGAWQLIAPKRAR